MNPLDDLTTHTDGLKDQAKEVLRKAGDQLSEQTYHLRDVFADARYNSEDYIQNNPWSSVVLAASIGFLVGVIVARR